MVSRRQAFVCLDAKCHKRQNDIVSSGSTDTVVLSGTETPLAGC